MELPQTVTLALEETSPATGSGMALAIAPVAGALVLSRFERYYLVAIMLSGLGGVMAIFGIVTDLAGLISVHGSVRPPGCRPLSACFATSSESFCGSAQYRRPTSRNRCGAS
jgi:hypothetical protein